MRHAWLEPFRRPIQKLDPERIGNLVSPEGARRPVLRVGSPNDRPDEPSECTHVVAVLRSGFPNRAWRASASTIGVHESDSSRV